MKLASDFRQSARDALKGKWGIAIVTGLVASLLGASTHGNSSGGGFGFSGDLSSLFDTESGTDIDVSTDLGTEGFGSIQDIFNAIDTAAWAIFGTVVAIAVAIGLVVGIAYFLLGSIVSVGYAKFNLNLIDAEKADLVDIFGYFKHWKTTVLANLLRSCYIFLWSLLCFIPGIIATYTYAMVPYIMADNPELTAREACERSKQMMDGNRMRLFCLTFSFIGWSLLCVLTCGIGYVALTPYIEAAVADFYREISDTRKSPVTDEDIPIYIPES